MRDLYLHAYKMADGGKPDEEAKPPYGSSLVRYLNQNSPDSVTDYSKGQAPFFPGPEVLEGKGIHSGKYLRDRDKLIGKGPGAEIGRYSWAQFAAPYLSALGENRFVEDRRRAYQEAVRKGVVPGRDFMDSPWANRDTKFPVYADTDYNKATNINYQNTAGKGGRILIQPQLGYANEDPINPKPGSLLYMRRQAHNMPPLSKMFHGFSLDPTKATRQHGYYPVLGHELGHLSMGGSRVPPIEGANKSNYQFDNDEEFKTALLNGMISARYLTGNKLDNPADVARLLDELRANPHLLDYFNGMPDGGRLFRSYVFAHGKDPKLAMQFRKAISILGSLITNDQTRWGGRGMPGHADPADPYGGRVPFSFGQPDYSNVS